MTKKHLCAALLMTPLISLYADYTVHQTVKKTGEPPREITQYISDAKMRMDIKQGTTETVAMVEGNQLERCTLTQRGGTRGKCETIHFDKETVGNRLQMVSFTNHKVTKLNKTGTYAGRKCQFFSRTLTTTMTMTAAKTAMKHSEEFCVDTSVHTPAMKQFEKSEITNAFMTPDVRKRFDQEESKATGLTLYSKIVLDDGTADAMRALAGKMKNNPAFKMPAPKQDETITETTSVTEGKLPDSTFVFPSNMKPR